MRDKMWGMNTGVNIHQQNTKHNLQLEHITTSISTLTGFVRGELKAVFATACCDHTIRTQNKLLIVAIVARIPAVNKIR
jgi:hypothetical protein